MTMTCATDDFELSTLRRTQIDIDFKRNMTKF